MSRVTLVLGGARSGKSRYAEGLAEPYGHRTYIATAEPFDDEMRERITIHRARRGASWTTRDIPIDLAAAIGEEQHFVLVDCITVWLGNLMHREADVLAEIEKLARVLEQTEARVVLVSNEVGLSIVPENAMARRRNSLKPLPEVAKRSGEPSYLKRLSFLSAASPLAAWKSAQWRMHQSAHCSRSCW